MKISREYRGEREKCGKVIDAVSDGYCVILHVVTSSRTKARGRGLENRRRPSWWRDVATRDRGVFSVNRGNKEGRERTKKNKGYWEETKQDKEIETRNKETLAHWRLNELATEYQGRRT